MTISKRPEEDGGWRMEGRGWRAGVDTGLGVAGDPVPQCLLELLRLPALQPQGLEQNQPEKAPELSAQAEPDLRTPAISRSRFKY